MENTLKHISREFTNINLNGKNVNVSVGDSVMDINGNICEIVAINHVYDLEFNPVNLIIIKGAKGERVIKPESIVKIYRKNIPFKIKSIEVPVKDVMTEISVGDKIKHEYPDNFKKEIGEVISEVIGIHNVYLEDYDEHLIIFVVTNDNIDECGINPEHIISVIK